jgi:transposase
MGRHPKPFTKAEVYPESGFATGYPGRWHGRTFRREEIAKTRSASARIRMRSRNQLEWLFNKIKQCWRVATRYDKLAANYLAFVKLAAIRIWLRANDSAP